MPGPDRRPVTEAQWLTIAEAAEELRVGQSLMRKLVKDGVIPARQLGRVVRIPRRAVLDMSRAQGE